jgi:hypothetical protein
LVLDLQNRLLLLAASEKKDMKTPTTHQRPILLLIGFWISILTTLGFAVPLNPKLNLGGAGWLQYDYIGKSSQTDRGIADYTGKGILSGGAQITLENQILEQLKIAAGLGVVATNNLARTTNSYGGYAPPINNAFVSTANFTYEFTRSNNFEIFLRGGLFSYIYNPDVKNLGLYLLRGPVSPGFLLSGFETKEVLPVADVIGLQLHHQVGRFQGDVLLTSETEFYPYFDISPVYVANYQVHESFRIGVGVNFYHLFSVDKNLTQCDDFENCGYVNKDTSGLPLDTTQFSYDGTKLMANFSFDPKRVFAGSDLFGEEDFKLYGEIALIGLKNGLAYKKVYGDYLYRMPVMMGFNLPAFHYLDHLAIEVEWYGAPYQDDLERYKNTHEPVSPMPVRPFPLDYAQENFKRDNWKWSLHGAKMIQSHVKISFQVANDHYRPGVYVGFGDSSPPLRQALLITPKDWHASSKIAFFF